MKKRLLSFLLMLVMSISMASPAFANAAGAEVVQEQAKYSQWVIGDLLYGDTYGIYPLSWYEKGITGPIKEAQFRVLLGGLKGKILETECATQSRSAIPNLDNSITVEEALEAFYTILSNYDFTLDLGANGSTKPVDYMKLIGVYTGKNGELALKDKCSVEMAMVMATRIVTVVYNALDAASKGFFWEIKSGDNTAYLLGSIHLASDKIYPLSQKILSAFFNADALVLEADLFKAIDQEEVAKLQMFTDGTTLKDHLPEETYQLVIETAAKIGYTEEMIEYVKPWVLYLIFEATAVAGGSNGTAAAAQLGIDMNFTNLAYIYQKPVQEIEGALFQYRMLDSFSPELVNYLLINDAVAVNAVLEGSKHDDVTDISEILDMWLEYWHEGDLDAFKLSYNGDPEATEAAQKQLDENTQKLIDEMYTKMFTERDQGMANYIDNLLKAEGSNTYFVVVGAGHYAGDNSAIKMLQEKGYEVVRVK